MKYATEEQITDACLTRSASDARRYLEQNGLYANSSRCNIAISRLIEAGKRGKMSTTNVSATIVEPSVAQAIEGCRQLLRRMLQAEQHCISDRDVMAAALRDAGLVA